MPALAVESTALVAPSMVSVPMQTTVIDFVAEQFPVSSVIVSWQPAGNELAAGIRATLGRQTTLIALLACAANHFAWRRMTG
jgi:hypothetical protein